MNGVNYLLVVFLATFSFGLFKGYRKGFLRLAVYLAGLLMVIIIVTKISPYVSDFLIDNTNVYNMVREKIVDLYVNQNNVSPEVNQTETIQNFGLPQIMADALIRNNTEDMYSKLAVALFEEYLSVYLAKIVIRAGSFVGLFVAFGIIMFIILMAIKIIEKIPVLKTFNRMLGMVAGGGMVIIFVWIFFIAITMLFYDSLGNWMLNQIKSSQILTFLFNNNQLFKFIL